MQDSPDAIRSCMDQWKGTLWLLGCEAQLGPRPVALRLGVDGSEGQVDAWAPVMVLLRHLMLADEQRQVCDKY